VEWNNHMGCVTATYVPRLKKYLMCVTDGWPTVAKMTSYILEADQITGPWRMVAYLKDFGEQAYFLNFPSKFISPDGKTLWLCYSANFSPGWNGVKLKFNPHPGGRYGMLVPQDAVTRWLHYKAFAGPKPACDVEKMQPSKRSSVMNAEYAVLVGLDWADQKHDLCWRDTASGQRHTLVLKNRPECINAWVVEQLARHPEGRMAVCLEQSRGTVIYGLMGYPQIDLYPVNPLSLAEYRKVHHPGGAKDDPKDAALLLDLLERHPELLRRWEPDTEQTRLLRSLCEDRRKLVNQRTAMNNRLCARLKEYYPQALDLIGDHAYSPMACAWLRRWPRFEALAASRPDTVRRFYHTHHVRAPRGQTAGPGGCAPHNAGSDRQPEAVSPCRMHGVQMMMDRTEQPEENRP
jgi:hypothetical protein